MMIFPSKNSSILVLCLFLCLQLATAKNVHFNNCRGTSAVVSVDISPCEKEPCVFYKGTNVTYTVTFKPSQRVKNSEQTKLKFVADAGIMKKNLPLKNPMACENHGIICPLEPGVQVTLVSTSFVEKRFPAFIPFRSNFYMYDQEKKIVFCLITKNIIKPKYEEKGEGY